jgi:hypothetical protein
VTYIINIRKENIYNTTTCLITKKTKRGYYENFHSTYLTFISGQISEKYNLLKVIQGEIDKVIAIVWM